MLAASSGLAVVVRTMRAFAVASGIEGFPSSVRARARDFDPVNFCRIATLTKNVFRRRKFSVIWWATACRLGPGVAVWSLRSADYSGDEDRLTGATECGGHGRGTMSSTIKFGTSGWRAIVADEFTVANIRLAVAGIAAYVKTQPS